MQTIFYNVDCLTVEGIMTICNYIKVHFVKILTVLIKESPQKGSHN